MRFCILTYEKKKKNSECPKIILKHQKGDLLPKKWNYQKGPPLPSRTNFQLVGPLRIGFLLRVTAHNLQSSTRRNSDFSQQNMAAFGRLLPRRAKILHTSFAASSSKTLNPQPRVCHGNSLLPLLFLYSG